MTTPRKNWFKQPDQINAMGWTDAVVADFTRLAAFLNTRWARHGLSPQEAGEADLTPQEMMLVCNVQNTRSARRRLLALPTDTPLGIFRAEPVSTEGASRIKVSWPKFAEFQGYQDRQHPNSGQPPGNLDPGDAPSEKKREEKRQEEEEKEESHFLSSPFRFRSQKKEQTKAPDDLTDEEMRRLSPWIREKHPYYKSKAKRRQLVDACLTYHRAKGTVSADWEAECGRWIDREATYNGKSPRRVALGCQEPLNEPKPRNGHTESLATVLNGLGRDPS